jgi:serine/threonine protein kinase
MGGGWPHPRTGHRAGVPWSGVSRQLEKSVTATYVGTNAYMAPERVLHEPYDARSDVWSLGVTMCELVCQCAGFDRVPWEPRVPMPLVLLRPTGDIRTRRWGRTRPWSCCRSGALPRILLLLLLLLLLSIGTYRRFVVTLAPRPQCIVSGPPPQLEPGVFSEELCHLVQRCGSGMTRPSGRLASLALDLLGGVGCSCLVLRPQFRPTTAELQAHPFVQRYEGRRDIVLAWINHLHQQTEASGQ